MEQTVDSSASRMLYKSCDRLGISASEAGRFSPVLPGAPQTESSLGGFR